jgi:hypothetical protein
MDNAGVKNVLPRIFPRQIFFNKKTSNCLPNKKKQLPLQPKSLEIKITT